MDVLANMFNLFATVKELKCHDICPPQEVQCVHMYSVYWDALVVCTYPCFDNRRYNISPCVLCMCCVYVCCLLYVVCTLHVCVSECAV